MSERKPLQIEKCLPLLEKGFGEKKGSPRQRALPEYPGSNKHVNIGSAHGGFRAHSPLAHSAHAATGYLGDSAMEHTPLRPVPRSRRMYPDSPQLPAHEFLTIQ